MSVVNANSFYLVLKIDGYFEYCERTMNYLAHIYLSGDSDEIMLGNFIGDYVKGNKYLNYPDQVAFGIRLHRRIDLFTDQHPDVRKCIDILRPGYGRYAGIVTDVFF